MQDGRYQVLRTLAKDFHLRKGVDLKLIAEATEGFSPADLKSLMVSAQLSRLEAELYVAKLVSIFVEANKKYCTIYI